MRIRAALVGAAALVAIGAAVASADETTTPDPGWSFACTGNNAGSAECPYGAENIGDPLNFTGADEPFPPTWFYMFGFLVVSAGIAGTVMRVKTARRMAERAGLDPSDAAWTSLLSENGLPAAYVTSNLPRRDAQPAAPTTRTVEQRLGELKRLHDKGVINPEEYASRRAEILDDV